ncbi:hypothetical protein FRX31_003798, partial [Thalictrum thalictroides]
KTLEIMDTKCIRAIFILVVLSVVVKGETTNNIFKHFTCYPTCYGKCLVLKRDSVACVYVCMKHCFGSLSNAASPKNFCQLGCAVDLCSDLNNDEPKLESCMGSCSEKCSSVP